MLENVPWQSLGTPERELTLSNTLPTGQSFRWYRTEDDTFTGVIGDRVVRASDSTFFSTSLQEYFREVQQLDRTPNIFQRPAEAYGVGILSGPEEQNCTGSRARPVLVSE